MSEFELENEILDEEFAEEQLEKTAENPTALSPAEQAELAELDDELAHYIEQYHPAEDAPPVQPKQNS